jgi:hypothetical protein
MAYFLSKNASYTQEYEPEHTYTFRGLCVISKQPVSVTINGRDLYFYHQGEHIQDAFPYLTKEQREWMMTGMYEFPSFEEPEH